MQKGGCEFVRTKYCMTQATYTLGIDIGSTTVKIAILDEAHQILFSDYERHFASKLVPQLLKTGIFYGWFRDSTGTINDTPLDDSDDISIKRTSKYK